MSNILFFYTPHKRLNMIAHIELEIILNHLYAGDTVHIVGCRGDRDLKQCVTNHDGRRYFCSTCKIIQDKILNIAQKHGNIILHNYKSKKNNLNIPLFSSIEDIKKYEYNSVNIGFGATSLAITLLRDHRFDPRKQEALVHRNIVRMVQTIDTLSALCEELKPSMVYTFNGRMAEYAAVVNWCKVNNQPFKVYEFTSRPEKYHIIHNTIPHDIDYQSAQIIKYWDREDVFECDKIAIGSRFFENTRNGISLLEESFITAQKTGELPLIDSSKEIITFFNSSIDEFAAVPGWENHVFIFKAESDAIIKTCKYFENDTTKQFVLRIHPNLSYLDNAQTRNFDKLRNLKNLIIIEPTSTISSYSLIDISSKIITFGSTMGIEATYFNKTTILLGLCFYRYLDASYVPNQELEYYRLLQTKDLVAKPKINAIKYGYWWLSFGEIYKNRGVIYAVEELNLSTLQKFKIISQKIFSKEILQRFYKLLMPVTYKKLKTKRFRNSLIKEIAPWNRL